MSKTKNLPAWANLKMKSRSVHKGTEDEFTVTDISLADDVLLGAINAEEPKVEMIGEHTVLYNFKHFSIMVHEYGYPRIHITLLDRRAGES